MANTGTDPRRVISPQANWQLIDVLVETDNWSMALGRWKSENGDWRPVLAQRWNGREGSKGNPVSRGFATWFVLPDETYPLYLESEFVPEEKRPLAQAVLGLPNRRPQRSDKVVMATEDLPEALVRRIASSEMDPRFAYLDETD
ncbi:MAG: hypothetical protein ACREFZ_02625 [Acetobacteraceae bacterium]